MSKRFLFSLQSTSTSGLITLSNSNTIGSIYTTGGSVGIHNTAPTATLDVSGGIRGITMTTSNLFVTNASAASLSTAQLQATDITVGTLLATTGVTVGTLLATGQGRFNNGILLNNTTNLQFLDAGGSAKNIVSVDVTSTTMYRSASTVGMFINPDLSSPTYINYNNTGGTIVYNGTIGTLKVNTGGNVGISNTGLAPEALLHVHQMSLGTTTGSSSLVSSFTVNDGNLTRLQVKATRFTSGNDWTTTDIRLQKRVDTTDMGYIAFPGTEISLATGSGTQTERIRANNNGVNMYGIVGINTSSSSGSYSLDVNGLARATSYYLGTGGEIRAADFTTFSYDSAAVPAYGAMWRLETGGSTPTGYFTGWGGIRLFTSGLPRMSISTSGNVGIGTTGPSQTLSVNGTWALGAAAIDTSAGPTSTYGPYIKNGSWDTASTSHNILFTSFVPGSGADNLAGSIHIFAKNTDTVTPKIAYYQGVVLKVNGNNTALTQLAYQKSSNVTNFTLGNVGNDVIVTTDSDMIVSFSFIGSV